MKYARSVLFLGIMAAMPLVLSAQTDARNWRKLGGEVCMPLEELHIIAAKRAVSNELNIERARIMVRQSQAIENLQRQLDLYREAEQDLMDLTADAFAKRDFVLDANIDLQRKLGKQTGWATVGKVGTVMVGCGLIITALSLVTP